MSGGKSKAVTVGYRYYLGLHFGMCHGPIDSIEQIQVGERLAWSGNQTASGSIYINAPELFGGESKEGGIQGTLDVMMGEPTQGTNSYLTTQQGSPQPAYRGILGLVYRGGLIACNNPYVKPWATRVRRVLKGWHNDQVWYSSKASVSVGSGIIAANPAHIVYECLTNPSWGMGYPSSLIDNSSFQTAADTFFAEGLGLCIMWSQQDSLDNFIQLVLDHAGAVLSQDSGGGYFKLKALRGDYIPSSLELFDDNNGKVVSLEKIERTTYTENVNEIAIQYTDATTGRNSSIYVQNLSNVQAQGAVVSQTRQYPGIPNANLAARIGMRDLKATTSGLARITFVANRSAYNLVPGDVIRFAWQPAGIVSISLRVTRIDYGPLTSGLIRIEGIEDVFGLPATVYADPPPIAWTPPNYTPQPAGSTVAMEATYKDLYDVLGPNDIGTVDATDGYLLAIATRPANALSFNYQLQTRAGTAAYESRNYGDWAPTGTLVDGISKTATSIALQGALDLDVIALNTLALLGTGSTAEIVQVTAVNLDTYTLTIKRGCVDTTPKAWPSGTRFTSYELHAATDEITYVSGELVSARFLTKSSTGTLAEASAPVATVTMSQRAARPYPPALVRFNGQAWPATIQNSVVVTWAHRDRLLQVDQVLDQEAASVGPETGTTYRARVLDADTSAVLVDQPSITLSEFAWGAGASGNRTIEIRAVRDGLDSWQLQSHTFAFTSIQLPWTPANLTGLMGWFDADDAATVTMTGTNVTQWNDKSGRGMHADAPITTKPTRAVASLNGRTTIAFGGSTAMRLNYTTSGVAAATASGTFRAKSGGSMIVLYRANPADTSASGRIVVGFGGGTGTTNRFSMRVNDVSANIVRIVTKRLDADADATLTGTVNRSTNWTIFGGSIDWANNDAWLYENGALTTSSTTHGTAGATSDTNSVWSAIGGFLSSATAGGSFFRGNIAEIIIADVVWDADTRQRLEGYLAWKWGAVDSLPTTHPWKYQPPALDYARTSTSTATVSASGTVT